MHKKKDFQIWLFFKFISIRVCQVKSDWSTDSVKENKCEGSPKLPICHSWQTCSTTKCNTNCYIYMYMDVSNGDLYIERGCNDGNQLTNNLEDFTTYNLGRIVKNLKKFFSDF